MSLYLVAYDIADNGRRRRVAKTLARFGKRVQESVFEVALDPEDLPDLRLALGIVLRRDDIVDIVPIDERGTRRRMSWMKTPESWSTVLFAP